MVTSRMEQMDALIKREVARELQRLFPDDLITITEVHVTKDLAYAKIWITSPKDQEDALKKCRGAAKEIRGHLARSIVARKVPSLNFVIDTSLDYATKIENLIKEMKRK